MEVYGDTFISMISKIVRDKALVHHKYYVKNRDRFCAAKEMICACVYVRERERVRDTRCITQRI